MKTEDNRQLMMKTRTQQLVATLILMVARLAGPLAARPRPDQFVPFKNFVADTAAANIDEYRGRQHNSVRDTAAFELTRQHFLTMYQDVEVSHTFVIDNDYIVCS